MDVLDHSEVNETCVGSKDPLTTLAEFRKTNLIQGQLLPTEHIESLFNDFLWAPAAWEASDDDHVWLVVMDGDAAIASCGAKES